MRKSFPSKVFHPSSPHAVGNLTNSPSIGSRLGEGGANFGFYSYLTDLESKRVLPAREMFDPAKIQPVVQPGIKVGDSFEVAVFIVGLILLFGVFILACFALSWMQKQDRPTVSPPTGYALPTRRTRFDY